MFIKVLETCQSLISNLVLFKISHSDSVGVQMVLALIILDLLILNHYQKYSIFLQDGWFSGRRISFLFSIWKLEIPVQLNSNCNLGNFVSGSDKFSFSVILWILIPVWQTTKTAVGVFPFESLYKTWKWPIISSIIEIFSMNVSCAVNFRIPRSSRCKFPMHFRRYFSPPAFIITGSLNSQSGRYCFRRK